MIILFKMSERNLCTEVLILTVKNQGENNRVICALSPELGIFYAILYGGPKSKLKSLVQPFYSGKMWLYDDTLRNSKKITDFDPENPPSSFRNDIYKIMAANLACELVLKTKAAGEWQKSYVLLKSFLKGIDLSEEKEARLGTLRFLWRYTELLGIQPDVRECCCCGENLLVFEKDSVYVDRENGVACFECARSYEEGSAFQFKLNKEALVYLDSMNILTPGQVRRLTLKSESVYKIKQLAFFLAEKACGTRLNSLEMSNGIL